MKPKEPKQLYLVPQAGKEIHCYPDGAGPSGARQDSGSSKIQDDVPRYPDKSITMGSHRGRHRQPLMLPSGLSRGHLKNTPAREDSRKYEKPRGLSKDQNGQSGTSSDDSTAVTKSKSSLDSEKESNSNSLPVPVGETDQRSLAVLEAEVPFVELLARSNFSFLQGASHPEEMTEQAIRHNYRGVCITDLNGLYGIVRGFRTASVGSHFTASVVPPQDFRYRIGAELTLTDASSIAFLPMSFEGYSNLCLLLTEGKRNVAKGFSQVTIEQIRKHNSELIAMPLPPYTEERFLELQEIFQDRLYLPVWRDLTWESLSFGQMAFSMEVKHGAQLFVTQRPFMHAPERKALFDVLTCIHHHTSLEKAEHILIQNSERYLRPLQDLQFLWKDRPDLLKVTVNIADRITFKMSDIRYRYPNSKLPEGMSPSDYLRSLTEKGIQRRFPNGTTDKVLKQINYELELIKDLEYEDYFLTLHEICQFADEQGILYQGRGSAANSIVCYCIGLTSVNPEDIDLLFERFISRERQEPPDIDIDFEHERREEVIQHIYRTYDAEHAAMVCTVIRFKSRLALRETAKVLEVPLATVNAMIRYMGRDGLRRLHEGTPERLWEKFGLEEWRWMLLLRLSEELKGFPRHLGIHTGGFLITQDPITHIVPVEKATMNGRYVIQWNKDDVNDLKLMKIDVLALGMLTALRKALQMLKSKKQVDWNLASFPRNDTKTYDMICRAETVGVFQIESRAQMNTLPRLRPRCHYDLVIEIALVRPGPLQGGMVHPYLRRRAGQEKVVSIHPDLDKVLEKTMGVPIFQEQVMKIAVAAAGFSPGEADELRRVMSAAWRQKGTMEGLRARLMAGMKEKGLTDAMCEQIYKTIEGFASYGFPESHSASFALLTYASSYLKCHHPDVFVCSLLNSQPMGFYPARVLIEEAQRNGVEFQPIDIQQSGLDYELVEEPRYIPSCENPLLPVRLGLRSIGGIPDEMLQRIFESRTQHGEFVSLEDLIRRTELPRAILTKLAAAGALSSFGFEPRHLLWKIESLSLDQQSFLWGQSKENTSEDQQNLPFESNWESMLRETEQMGYALNKHPLSILRSAIEFKNEELRKRAYIPYSSSRDFARIRDGQKLRVAGLVGITQRPPTAKGMCFITLEDEFGCMNIVIPPDVYNKDRMTIYGKTLLEIQGYLEKRGHIINLKADRVFPLSL